MSDQKELTVKERMAINRHAMNLQKKEERVKNFFEVALGYTEEQAQLEAERCLNCKKPRCMEGCPVDVPIPEFIMAVRKGDMKEAVSRLKSTNNLPAICGRVCPQEKQCEEACILGNKNKPVAIGRLERYVADWELGHEVKSPEKAGQSPYKVAVIGSGPAGLTCAGDLAKLGHKVVIFESLHVAGGVLMYGIPEFRLPKKVVQAEIDYVVSLGVQIRTDYVIGKIFSLDDLFNKEGFDAVFLGTGAGLPIFMRIPGENYNGVYSANEFLTRVNLMKSYLFPEWDTPVKIGHKVAVIGAGNVAMDSARCALRLGMLESIKKGTSPAEFNSNTPAEFNSTAPTEVHSTAPTEVHSTAPTEFNSTAPTEVHIVYRRSAQEMPARAEEVKNAEEEGVIFNFLVNPVKIYGTEQGWVKGMQCIRMELGEPDASGRQRPVPVKGSEFDMDVDTVIVALGTRPNPLVFFNSSGLERTRWGTIVADEITGKTTKDKIWAGGDIVTGAATVISAMGAGKRAAREIHTYLKEKSGVSKK